MQNITKALIMVGSVILGIILLATLIHVLRIGGSVNKAYDESQLNYQTQAFNYQYEVYQKDDNTIIDIVTLLNLAYSANVSNEYNSSNYVEITVNIGGQVYRIPKDISKDGETFFNNNVRALERNQVYSVKENQVISVYDLINKPLNQLNILSFGDSSDKLSKIHIGEYVYFPDSSVVEAGNAGKAVVGTNGTTYKYVFDCDDDKIKYNSITGRISKMEFNCKENPLWELGTYTSTNPEWD